jgi:FSR family fosmidomycin resistance protein-like MFS transporter
MPGQPPSAATVRQSAPALAAVLILGFGHALVDLYVTAVTPLLPYFQQLWRLSATSLGLLAAATSVTGSILQPLLGYTLDRRGTSLLAGLGLLWVGAVVVVLGWLPSFAMLFTVSTVVVLGSAVYHPLGAALTRYVAPPDRRGLYLGLFMNVGNLGWAVAPFLIAWYVSAFGLRPLGWLALPALVGAAALVWLRLSLARSPRAASPGSPEPLASRAVRLRGVVLLLASTILRSWVAGGIQTYLPLYLVQHGRTLAAAGSTLTTFILAGTLTGILLGYLADRWSRRLLYACSLLLSAAAFTWFLQAPAVWSGPAIALTGAALLGSIPLTVVLVQEMLPNHAGTGSGLIIGFAGGVGGLLLLASGALADRFGLGAALLWLVPALPAAALCALTIPEEACRQPGRVSPVYPGQTTPARKEEERTCHRHPPTSTSTAPSPTATTGRRETSARPTRSW